MEPQERGHPWEGINVVDGVQAAAVGLMPPICQPLSQLGTRGQHQRGLPDHEEEQEGN